MDWTNASVAMPVPPRGVLNPHPCLPALEVFAVFSGYDFSASTTLILQSQPGQGTPTTTDITSNRFTEN